MANEVRLLVTQALDERDLLNKKINDKIKTAVFIDVVKHNEETVMNRRVDRETFQKEAQSSFQQINDLISRYDRIEAAIVASNAVTKVVTSYGEFTVAAAIALKKRLGQNADQVKNSFEDCLIRKMQREYDRCMIEINDKNSILDITAENMRMSILGKDTKGKDDKPLEVVDSYVRENKTELVDPLGILDKLEELKSRRSSLLKELETQIKVSNATTFITI